MKLGESEGDRVQRVHREKCGWTRVVFGSSSMSGAGMACLDL